MTQQLMTERILHDICAGFSLRTPSFCRHYFHHHTLAYLYDGNMNLRNQCGEELSVGRGDCAFIGRDSYSSLYAEPGTSGRCCVTFFSLPRRFLCEFYQTLDEAVRTSDGEAPSALHRIAVHPDVESLFRSLSPYFLYGQELPEETARLKMTEAAYVLLNSDRGYAAALFDFASTCKMNMLDLLVKHDNTDFRWKELEEEDVAQAYGLHRPGCRRRGRAR